MKIYIRELTDIETELHFTQEQEWVKTAVERVDEKSDEPIRGTPQARPINAEFSLSKVDEVIVVNGSISTNIRFLCSRCAAWFHYPMNPHFSALFCQDPVMAGVGHLEMTKTGPGRGLSKPAGQNKGHARHAHDQSHDTSGPQDLDITYLSSDFIELGDVLTEQLQLQVPFQPLCKESCKGMCTQCGADLNQGRCACAKIAKNTAFSVLQNLKL
jgi:uncharacterized protein